MGAECKYELSQAAYVKLVLHSLKHRCSAVNGVLVGRLVEGSSPSPATVEISDAVPLSHAGIGLVPSLELSLNLVEEHFGAEGLSIVGYYHANERSGDSELGSAAKRIGDHIFRYFPRAAVLLLDVEKMEELPKRKGRDPVVQLCYINIFVMEPCFIANRILMENAWKLMVILILALLIGTW